MLNSCGFTPLVGDWATWIVRTHPQLAPQVSDAVPLPSALRESTLKVTIWVPGSHPWECVVRTAALSVPVESRLKLTTPLIGPHPLPDQIRLACHLPANCDMLLLLCDCAVGKNARTASVMIKKPRRKADRFVGHTALLADLRYVFMSHRRNFSRHSVTFRVTNLSEPCSSSRHRRWLLFSPQRHYGN
jgi:hypothetical protein